MQEGKVEKELMMNLDIPCGVSICHCQVNHNGGACNCAEQYQSLPLLLIIEQAPTPTTFQPCALQHVK